MDRQDVSRWIREQESRVLRQAEITAQIAATGQPTQVAEKLLQTMEERLVLMRAVPAIWG